PAVAGSLEPQHAFRDHSRATLLCASQEKTIQHATREDYQRFASLESERSSIGRNKFQVASKLAVLGLVQDEGIAFHDLVAQPAAAGFLPAGPLLKDNYLEAGMSQLLRRHRSCGPTADDCDSALHPLPELPVSDAPERRREPCTAAPACYPKPRRPVKRKTISLGYSLLRPVPGTCLSSSPTTRR